ncbi:MAG: nucleotidyl transferase AbiEii/AbiGii toxin family protein [Candidatus Micrarchaeota archaeon]
MTRRINFEGLRDIALRLSEKPPFTADNIYVDLLLTATIKEIQDNFDFVLKGGTAIIKAWGTPYRFSNDLDFSFYYSGSSPRKHYRMYEKKLLELVGALGFKAANEESDKHREGGRIFILKLMDGPGFLEKTVKLSISSMDECPCFNPTKKQFQPVVKIPEETFGLLYPDLLPGLNNVEVKVLEMEELCAEKIRALATRGATGEWGLVLRDAVDLYVMDKQGILDKVLASEEYRRCIRKKFLAVEETGYWEKFKGFLASTAGVGIGPEERAIFFDQSMVKEAYAAHVIEKIRKALKEILGEELKK